MTDTSTSFLVIGLAVGVGASTLVYGIVEVSRTLLRNHRQKKNAMLTPLIGVVLPKDKN